MITPLRLGFLFSGLLHVAVVAAFSLSSRHEVPAVDQARPITLNLAVFQPEPAAILPPSAPEPLAEPEPEPELVTEPEPPRPAEPAPTLVTKKLEPAPPRPEPQVVKRIRRPQPKAPRRIEAEPAKKPLDKVKSAKTEQVPRKPIIQAAVTKPEVVQSAANKQQKQHYLAALAARINRSKYYPLGSRRRGEEGRVLVRFVVQKNGELTDLTIVESSGSRRLDAAALKTLRRVTPFRPIPDALNRDQWSISVPIAFSLSG